MKKIIYILLFTFSASFVFTSCTDEEVAPKTQTDSLGGNGMEGRI